MDYRRNRSIIPIGARVNQVSFQAILFGIGDPMAGTWYDSPSLLFRRYIIEFEGGLQIKRLAGIPSGNPYPRV
ncbi:MAG: hypothetical protein IPI30_22280 [Saprospiraceae bacterium]|nr:hypothetical protein [Candidatus Vicinibacter affinis]